MFGFFFYLINNLQLIIKIVVSWSSVSSLTWTEKGVIVNFYIDQKHSNFSTLTSHKHVACMSRSSVGSAQFHWCTLCLNTAICLGAVFPPCFNPHNIALLQL